MASLGRKFEIFCDEDTAQTKYHHNSQKINNNKKEITKMVQQQNHQQVTNKLAPIMGHMNPPNNVPKLQGKKLQVLQAQPVHSINSRQSHMTVANLKRHDAQLMQSSQQILNNHQSKHQRQNNFQQHPPQQKNHIQSFRNSLSTCSDASETGIKTISVEEAAKILQSRLAERNALYQEVLDKSFDSASTSPMSVDGGIVGSARVGAGDRSMLRRTSSAMDFKENEIICSKKIKDLQRHDENHYDEDDTEIEDDGNDENRYYADERAFDDSDISVSEDDVHDCSINFDVSTIFKCDDYATDIHQYLISIERKPCFRPKPNYMRYQEDIDSSMRCVLVDWMVDVAEEHGLQHDTLFQAVAMVDRFLSEMGIATPSFQLLAVAALFTASKYEEIYPPDLYQFVDVTDRTYTAAQVLSMEQIILNAVDFRISGPTSYYFLCKILTFNSFPVQVYHLAQYLCYLTLMEDQPFLEYYPSEIAISACILAIYQLGFKDLITPSMIEAYHKANSDQIERRDKQQDGQTNRGSTRSSGRNHRLTLCVEAIHAMQEYAPSHKQKAIYNKFSSMTYDCVSGIMAISNIQAVINL